MRRLHRIVPGLLLVLLAACSGGRDRPTLNAQLFSEVRQKVAARTAPRAAPRPALTRAALDTVEVAAIEVTLENTDALAYLFVQAERGDDRAGRIVVWRTEDDATLALRNGVLIATRGLGGDLLSSAVQVAGRQPGPSGSGHKVMQIAARDNKAVQIALACEVTDLGPETITIVERRHATRHLRETCEGAGGTVINDYWTDAGAGLVWQSRQWAGPSVGYVRIRQLTN